MRLEDGAPAREQVVSTGEGRTDFDLLVDVDGMLAIGDAEVYAVTFQGQVAALATESGQPLWTREFSSYGGLTLAGDRVLQGVANILRSAAGPGDLACRLGGDEFCLLVAATGRESIMRIARFVVETAHALHGLQSSPPQIATLSIGASLLVPEQDWDDWYASVDAALYRAKRLGGNRVEWQEQAKVTA